MVDHERVRRKESDEGIQKRKREHDGATGDSKARHVPGDLQTAGPVPEKGVADLVGRLRRSRAVDASQTADILTELQRTHGNAYVQRLLRSRAVQAKMTVNPPDDIYEKEADQVAEAVTRKAAPGLQRQAEEEEEEVQTRRAVGTLMTGLQRQPEEEEEEVQTKRAVGTLMTGLQRQPAEEEEEVQTSAEGTQSREVSDALETRISAARGSGQALPSSIRSSFEPQFGRDFSEVRVHTDADADSLSRQLGARAFTTGQDIFFRSGDYQPESDEGRKLLGHEMTHVVQQGAAARVRARDIELASKREVNAGPGVPATRRAMQMHQGSQLCAIGLQEKRARKGPGAGGTKASPGMGTVKGAQETFYDISEPDLAKVPSHFQHGTHGAEAECRIEGAQELQVRRRGRGVMVSGIPWRASCTVDLPRWAAFSEAGEADRKEWNRFMAATRIHEQGHVDLAHTFVRNIPAPDRKITGASAEELQGKLEELASRLQRDLQKKHDEYDDDTGHGATQGASLRVPRR